MTLLCFLLSHTYAKKETVWLYFLKEMKLCVSCSPVFYPCNSLSFTPDKTAKPTIHSSSWKCNHEIVKH